MGASNSLMTDVLEWASKPGTPSVIMKSFVMVHRGQQVPIYVIAQPPFGSHRSTAGEAVLTAPVLVLTATSTVNRATIAVEPVCSVHMMPATADAYPLKSLV